MKPPLRAVEFEGVHKRFGDCISAKDLTFQISSGEIHALVGENGAGKSTSMKILFGLFPPDGGTLKVNGQEVHFRSPTEAMNLGIGMVHQHFMLAEPLSALDNILLFQKNTHPFQKLHRAEHKARLQKLADAYQFAIDLDKPVGQLSVGTQQRIEILKILSQDSKIIILDEPTAVLTPQETADLFKNLKKLKAEGRTIIIITHKLKEVMAIADSVTVLRAGAVVVSKPISQTSVEDLAEHMVGRKVKNLALAERSSTTSPKTLLQVKNLSLTDKEGSLMDLNFQVRAGEIVGIAGVEGNGQDALIRSLLEPKRAKPSGEVEFQGMNLLMLSAAQIRRQGLAAFPEDRLRWGVLRERPLFENFILGYQHRPAFSRWGFLKFKNILATTAAAMEKFDVRPRDPLKPLDKLSGGNQQKLVVARELQNDPNFILAAKPTRGVDIGAIEFIHGQLLEARHRGAGILLISSELEELMTLSDRILVLFKGQIVAEFLRERAYNEIEIGAAMGGQA